MSLFDSVGLGIFVLVILYAAWASGYRAGREEGRAETVRELRVQMDRVVRRTMAEKLQAINRENGW